MKKTIAKLINRIDRFLHINFDFLNLNKPGQFNKNYEWIYKYIESENVDLSKKTFIEVGSRDVLDSLDLVSKFNFLKAYAFEPSHIGIKESIKNLRQNIVFSEKIILFPFALGDENSIVSLYESTHICKEHIKPNIGSSSIFAEDTENNFQYEVPILKLDSLDINFSNNYMIIMDCEGSEYSVLKGADLAIKYSKYVCMESDYTRETGNCHDIKELLEAKGYKLIDCDWPNTPMGNLPDKVEVGENQFNIIFRNEKF